ncbi:MAG: tetratricopeptide repeat protein [Steroidobacteraceae bacterium]
MTLRRVIAAAVLVGAVAPSAEAARKPREPATLADLAVRQPPVRREEPVGADAGLAASSYEEFLRIPGTDGAMRAQALRRLGDLRLAEAEALRAGDGTSVPLASALTREAIAAYERLLEESPGGRDADVALYQLARAHESLGETDRALAMLDRLVAAHPGSVHFDEAQFRRGETLFSAQRYTDAERAYAAVLGRSSASAFRQQALYKHGWALFKQSRDDESCASFLALLDGLLAADGRARLAAQMSRPEQELAADALRALAITFAAAEGPVSLQAALDRHGAAVYEASLYRALGELYVEKERYQDGAEAYRAFARRRPMDPEAPLLLLGATEAYAKGGFTSLVLDGKRQLVEQYGPRSEFWRSQGPRLDPAVSNAVQTSVLDLAGHHHALAQKNGSAADRDLAVRWYRDYLEGFDALPQAPSTRLLLADLLFEGSRFEEAAAEYELAAYAYAVNPEAGRAGYAALVAYDKAEQSVPAERRPVLRLRAIDASLRFADTFPQQAEVPGVLTRTAKALFDAEDRERAESVAQRVLALGPRADAGQQLVAWTVLAHTYFDSARYAEAEQAYGQLAARLPAGDAQRPEVTERLAASVYRQAEARQASGDVAGAVREFLRVASVAPASPVRAKAEYDAAALLLTAGQWNEAAGVLENFRRDHPQHELQSDVTRKLAVAYLEGGRSREAAVELERVAANGGEDAEVRRASLWQAAELHAGADDVPAARRVYADYVARFPVPFEAALEARHELAELAARASDAVDRKRWLEELVTADAAAGAVRTDRSRLLAAEASLELAQPLDAAARAIGLVAPLERSLLAKKKALEAALAGYGRASEYGIAAVTTQSGYAMAELYRHFGRSLMESERPAGLSAEELEQYDLLLEEQAFPFEEKAIGIHEKNARLATQGVFDQWVQRSFVALAEMMPGRYARSEIAAGPDATPTTPPDLVPRFAAAREALDAGRNEEARSLLQSALDLDPVNAGGLNRLGVAERRLGRFAEARAAYERAIAADPAYAEPERNLAVLLDLYLGDPAQALAHYERYQSLAGEMDAQVAAWLVELRTRLGRVPRTAEVQP